jgi:arginyl-tRNA synthetase
MLCFQVARGRSIIIRPPRSVISNGYTTLSSTSSPITAAMTTLSTIGLETLLNGVGAESQIPSFSSADVQNSPVDIYLSYLAEILVQLTKCEPQVAYDSIIWPDDLCDLVVVAPRIRLKDVNPNELAVELSKKVGWHALFF